MQSLSVARKTVMIAVAKVTEASSVYTQF